MDKLHQSLLALFASISHTNYTRNSISVYEGYYASLIYAFLVSLGLDLIAEDVTSTGRIDLTVKIGKNIYIFEFKVDGKEADLAQIKAKDYHRKYREQSKEIYLIGIDFDSTTRNISSFWWEKV